MVIINIIELKNCRYWLLLNSNGSEKSNYNALKLYNYLKELNLNKFKSSFFEVKSSNINEFISQLLESCDINKTEVLVLFDYILQKTF
jgi:hypothetical protein